MGISQCKSRLTTGSFLRTSIVLMLLSLLPFLGFAQNANVKGIVYDETGAPAIGVKYPTPKEVRFWKKCVPWLGSTR